MIPEKNRFFFAGFLKLNEIVNIKITNLRMMNSRLITKMIIAPMLISVSSLFDGLIKFPASIARLFKS